MTDMSKRSLMKVAALTALTSAVLIGCGKKEEAAPAAAPAPAVAEAPKPAPLKIAFAYVGPVGDGGWTFAHDNGRKAIEAEFGDKIDAQNARATTNYLRSLGLQLVLAAPDTAQGTLSGVLDSYIELFRDGDLLQAERIEVQAAARALLLSDQFDLHPELLAEETARIERQQAPA